jgi:hypothetical protein
MPVSDLAYALAYPAILSASALYAGCSAWRRRRRARRGEVTPGVPPIFFGRLDLIREVEARASRAGMVAGHAERIAAAEFERVADLYDVPAVPPVDVVSRVNAPFQP